MTTKKPSLNDANPDQQATLCTYAQVMGEGWKEKLMADWRDGYRWLPPTIETAYLQQIRNRLGPSWLEAVAPEVDAEVATWP